MKCIKKLLSRNKSVESAPRKSITEQLEYNAKVEAALFCLENGMKTEGINILKEAKK